MKWKKKPKKPKKPKKKMAIDFKPFEELFAPAYQLIYISTDGHIDVGPNTYSVFHDYTIQERQVIFQVCEKHLPWEDTQEQEQWERMMYVYQFIIKSPSPFPYKEYLLSEDIIQELIPYKNKWLSSYETLSFDTADGDLDFGQYALDKSGKGYYIRTKPKSEAQFEWVDLSYDVSKIEKVNVVADAHCYYDEFLTAVGAEAIWKEVPDELPSGGVLRIQSTGTKYWDTAKIKNYPQPEKTEMVEKLPPPEPPQPRNEPHSIALDAVSNSGTKSSISSYSWDHECSGNNRLLVVGNSWAGSGFGTSTTSITFNGDALTAIRSDDIQLYPKYSTALYYRIAPDTGGAYTVAVTFSGTTDDAVGGAISYTGADQENQPDAHNGNATTQTKVGTVDVTTIVDNCWVVAVLVRTPEEGDPISGNTERWKVGTYAGSDTGGPKTPAGAQTMSWSWTNDGNWAISAASFAPAVSVEGAAGIMTTNTGYWGATF